MIARGLPRLSACSRARQYERMRGRAEQRVNERLGLGLGQRRQVDALGRIHQQVERGATAAAESAANAIVSGRRRGLLCERREQRSRGFVDAVGVVHRDEQAQRARDAQHEIGAATRARGRVPAAHRDASCCTNAGPKHMR